MSVRTRAPALPQRPQKRLDLTLLLRAQPQRLELTVPRRRGWRAVVVLDHLGQRRELPGVHVWRTLRHTAQRRRLVGPHERLTLGGRGAQLLAVLRLRVAVPARARELRRDRLPHDD